MSTSKPHIAAAAGLGALLPFIPELVRLIPALPSEVSNALCAVILAVAYAVMPKKTSDSKAGEAGYIYREAALWLAGVTCLAMGVACATLGRVKADPAQTARDTLKTAQLACLSCSLPNLPKAARDACAELEPVCKGLAGVCEESGGE